jgi:hypothetical protein
MLETKLSEAAAVRLEPQLWRLQWEHRSAEITLDRSDWPSVAVVSAQNSATALSALEAVRDAAYGREPDKAASAQPKEQMRLAVSPRELWLLDQFDSGRLLTTLQALHNVSITVQQTALIIDGAPDAAEAAAAEIRQTVAVGRASEGLAPASSPWLYSGEGFRLTWRTLDVAPDAADVLATLSGAQALRNAQGHLARIGVCLSFQSAPQADGFGGGAPRAMAAGSADARAAAAITLFGGRTANVDWAEHVFRSWLGRDMELELDILQPFASANTTLKGVGLADVALPDRATPGGDLEAWRSWCSHVLALEAPPAWPDGRFVDFGEDDSPRWFDWARYLSVDDLADWVIHLLTVLVLGRVAFLAFKARHIPQGGASAPHFADGGVAGQDGAPAAAQGGGTTPPWPAMPKVAPDNSGASCLKQHDPHCRHALACNCHRACPAASKRCRVACL